MGFAFTLPPSGEGARRADEGLRAGKKAGKRKQQGPHPSLRATFPRRGKEEGVKTKRPAEAGRSFNDSQFKLEAEYGYESCVCCFVTSFNSGVIGF